MVGHEVMPALWDVMGTPRHHWRYVSLVQRLEFNPHEMARLLGVTGHVSTVRNCATVFRRLDQDFLQTGLYLADDTWPDGSGHSCVVILSDTRKD